MTDASEYFKVAAANIRRAIDVKRAEINDLLGQIDNIQRDVNKNIDTMKNEIRLREVMIGRPEQNDPTTPGPPRPELTREVAQLQSQISDKQRDIAKTRDSLNDRISQLEREIVGLEQEAQGLEARA